MLDQLAPKRMLCVVDYADSPSFLANLIKRAFPVVAILKNNFQTRNRFKVRNIGLFLSPRPCGWVPFFALADRRSTKVSGLGINVLRLNMLLSARL